MKLILCCLTSLLCVFTTLCSASVERVEPAHWWVGMNEPVFQLMLYGPEVGTKTPEIHAEGIRIERVERVNSVNYLFLYLHVGEVAAPGEFEIQLHDAKDGSVERIAYSLRLRDANASLRKGFDSSDVIYLLMPDRFANGDPSNDSVPGMRETQVNRGERYGRHGGDLAGIIEHLDYVQDLGITALWLNPVLENDMKESSYHGYAITDFYKVDPRLGTMQDYVQLSRLAHSRGIKLIMDMVLNHCGLYHWWMEDLPDPDWINHVESYQETNHLRTTNQDPYASQQDTRRMREGWFVPSMPDLNLRHPLLADYMTINSIWWIETLGLGGIRMDTYPYPDKHAMSRWCARILEEYPNFTITGEEWSVNPLTLAYWQRGKVNRDGYQGNLPSLIDFPMQQAIKDAFQQEEAWGQGLMRLYEALSNDFLYPDPLNLVTFLGNHDTPRYFMEVGSDENAYRNAFVWLMTMRGIPQIYYGDEILMTHYESDSHGHIRNDFPGGWKGDVTNVFTGLNLSERQARNLEFTRKLLRWRNNQTVIHAGDLVHFGPEEGCYVYVRHDPNAAVMVVLNKNPQVHRLDLARFDEILSGYPSAYDVIDEKEVNLGEALTLSPQQPLILELRR